MVYTLSVGPCCGCFLLLASHYAELSMWTILQLSTHPPAVSWRMVSTLRVGQCCRWFVCCHVTLQCLHYADYSSTQHTCMCIELEDGLHTKCSPVLQLLHCLGCHIALYVVCRLSVNLVHMHVP